MIEQYQPFSPGSYEYLKNTQIWTVVLDQIRSPLSVSSASQTCPYFRDLLQERILTEVFKVLRDNGYIFSRYGKDFSLRKHLLHLRLVCKMWNRVVENLFLDTFQGNWKLHLLESSLRPLLDDGRLRNPYKLFYAVRLDLKQTAAWKNSKRLVSRNLMKMVHLKVSSQDTREKTKLQIISFLDAHGHFVRGLTFIADRKGYNATVMYQWLLSLMERMRNLQALVLLLRTKSENVEESEKLQECLQDSPFPLMPSVELLIFENCREEEDENVLVEILRNCPNLKSLHLPMHQKVEVGERLACTLKNLTKLQYYKVEERTLNKNTGQVNLLQCVPWKLNSLVLKQDTISNFRLFTWINLFGDHLENLDLDLSVCPIFRRNCPNLNLPRLRRLRVGYTTEDDSLDYISSLESLEHLEFGSVHQGTGSRTTLTDLLEYNADNQNQENKPTNIWRMFPRLRTVRVQSIYLSKRVTLQYTARRGITGKTVIVVKNVTAHKHNFKWSLCDI